MDYNSLEGIQLLNEPLAYLGEKRADFVRALFYKIAYKNAKKILQKQKKEINKLNKKIHKLETKPRTDFEEFQQQQIEKYWKKSEKLNEELIYYRYKYGSKKHKP